MAETDERIPCELDELTPLQGKREQRLMARRLAVSVVERTRNALAALAPEVAGQVARQLLGEQTTPLAGRTAEILVQDISRDRKQHLHHQLVVDIESVLAERWDTK